MAGRKRQQVMANGDATPEVPPLRLEWLDPADLKPNGRNWRTHPDSQIRALSDVISEVGWAGALLYNEATGKLIDGHARKELFEGKGPVPVLVGSWDEAQEAKILATLDPLSALAQADAGRLDALLREVDTGSAALQEMLAGLAERSGLEPSANGSGRAPDDPGGGGDGFDTPGALEGECRVKPGDLWVVGGVHRVLCGDSTKAEDVGRLMGDVRAEMVWTDPPYGVAIGDKNKFLNSIARSNRVEENLANDTLCETQLRQMFWDASSLAVAVCAPGAAWYVAVPAGPLHLRFGEVLRDLGIYRQTLIWVKNSATFAPMGVSYHWAHEPIFYGWLPNAGHRYHGDRKQTTVWAIDRPQASPEHPTMKPVDLVARALEHSSLPGEVVYDPFGGSGTTLVAADRGGRRALLMELEPKYVEVILRRAEAEGLSVEKAG